MEKFQEDVKKLLLYVGGKENIQAVSHCVTRMRFVLEKPELADVAAIESLPSAKGTFTQSGQFQVIIGNEVSEFYNAFTAYAGIEGVSKDSLKSSAKSNQTVLQRIMGALGEIFAPLIPALICGGLILGFRNIIGEIAMFDGQTLAQASQFWNGVYSFLWLIGEAVFHMLPVGIVWSITKKNGNNTDSWNHPWANPCFSAAVKWLPGSRNRGFRYSCMGFWFHTDSNDWLSGAGNRSHDGRLCPRIS